MASRSQRRKETQKQKRKKKKEQQRKRQTGTQQKPSPMSAGNTRHQQRVLRQRPTAWSEELAEDQAIYDDAVLETLTPDVTGQVIAVRDALQLACDARGEEALQRVSDIARSSPLSEWRLFLRGLVAWLSDDHSAAGETWKRLDFSRRPGRIAIAMMNSLRTDLQSASATPAKPDASEVDSNDWSGQLDEHLVYHAKLLRRVRFERAAIKMAETGVRIREPDETEDLLLGPRKIRWLTQFRTEYTETEPDLTSALTRVALGRAFLQNFSNLFDEAARAFQGPRHDPRNLLLSFFYFSKFQTDNFAQKKVDRLLKNYLEHDLPKNEALTEPLRGAIASQIHLQEAKTEIRQPMQGMLARIYEDREDPAVIRRHLQAAITAYPGNRAAYKTYVDWLETKLDDDRLTRPKREPFLKEQAQVMTEWSQALPDDVKPRMWLVDYLLENERTEEAKPHVDWLAASRQDDPRVRATPWKWQILEAMRLCRRKAWLKDVPARWEEAERLWPAWLSRDWLPYLKAAVTLRAGQKEQFESERQQILEESGRDRDSLSDACMMLGAAQQMRVPAADLKPLRAPVDQAVKNLGKLSDEELFSVSGFFWDLHRTQLKYPAYRMHGSKIVQQMFACFRENPRWVLEHLDDARVQAAILLCSEHRYLDNGYELKLPALYSKPRIKQHPMFLAARLNSVLKLRSLWRADQTTELYEQVREIAQTQSDPYYRYWFASLADDLEEVIADQQSSSSFGFGFNPFDFAFGGEDGEFDYDGDDEDDDEDLGFDPDCNCRACQAARRAYEAARK